MHATLPTLPLLSALPNREREAGRYIMFNPLCGGLDPDIARESLELIASEVLPRFRHSPSPRPPRDAS